MEYTHLQFPGSRITSELNNLRRTPNVVAKELGVSVAKLQKILAGKCSMENIYFSISKIGEFLLIDTSDLLLLEDDCFSGIKTMKRHESKLQVGHLIGRINWIEARIFRSRNEFENAIKKYKASLLYFRKGEFITGRRGVCLGEVYSCEIYMESDRL